MKIIITGASGLIGSALTQALRNEGHEPVPLRRETHTGGPSWSIEDGRLELAEHTDADAVIHLAGENIASGRWNAARKERILSSREKGTRLLCEHFAKSERRPRVIITASGTGIYGSRGDEQLDETSTPGSGFLAEVAQKWEAASAPAAEAGIRTVQARFGMVLSGDGGALASMLPIFKLGLGGPLGTGRQFISWISIEDVSAIIKRVLEDESFSGPLNCVAPNPVTSREFAKALGSVLHRPAFLPAPSFALRAALGEMADELLLGSTRAVPAALNKAGFVFKHPMLRDALAAILG
jgi:uncharacterized protein (TIGR01777 family)